MIASRISIRPTEIVRSSIGKRAGGIGGVTVICRVVPLAVTVPENCVISIVMVRLSAYKLPPVRRHCPRHTSHNRLCQLCRNLTLGLRVHWGTACAMPPPRRMSWNEWYQANRWHPADQPNRSQSTRSGRSQR